MRWSFGLSFGASGAGMSIIAVNSHSAASSPSTVARAANFQTLPPGLPRVTSIASSSTSPGPTLRRNFARSMPMK
jgi:hypothetical protein